MRTLICAVRPGWDKGRLFTLLSPALGAIALFFAIPLIAALLLSLTDFDIYALANWRNARFVGGGNYLRLLQDPLFWKVMRNTLVFVLVGDRWYIRN